MMICSIPYGRNSMYIVTHTVSPSSAPLLLLHAQSDDDMSAATRLVIIIGVSVSSSMMTEVAARRTVPRPAEPRAHVKPFPLLRPRKWCNESQSVLISIAVGSETRSCSWIVALLKNALGFSRRDTLIALHLSSSLLCSPDKVLRQVDAQDQDRVLINPVRLRTRQGHGSVLYAHLLNGRSASTRWAGCCCASC